MKLEFILWLMLWPLADSLANLAEAHTRKIYGQEPFSEKHRLNAAGLSVLVWIFIAILIYNS